MPLLKSHSGFDQRLAIEGGAPAVRDPLPFMYPGAMRLGVEEETAVLQVLRSKRLFRYYGPRSGTSMVEEFEGEFKRRLGAGHAVAVSSGSAALVCGLVALGVGPGDEVIIPAYTWVASAGAILAVGAVPVLAEIDETLTLDVADTEAKITPRTKAVMPVHMRGAPCNMQAITRIARSHGLKVIEDVAQAVGGTFHGQRLGTIGDVGAFSFQFNKIITCGEGGAATTDDPEIHERVLMYHDVIGGLRLGVPKERILHGLNFRMSELQGAVILTQLGRLESLLADMRRHKAALKSAIQPVVRGCGVTFRSIHDEEGDTGLALIFLAPSAERANRIAAALNAEGANAFVLYDPGRVDYHVYAHWTAIIENRTWSERGGPWRWHNGPLEYRYDMCPRSLDLLGRAVHLDVSPDMTGTNIQQLSDAVAKVLRALL